VLIALGDVLMWSVVPGLSLALFCALCVAAALALWPGRLTRRQVFLATAGTALCLLPLVELVQPLSLLVAMAGLPVILALIAGRRARGALRFWWAAPWFTITDVARVPSLPTPGLVRGALLGWALPVVVGGVFAALLMLANPVLDGFAQDLLRIELALPNPARLILWGMLALLIWPLLELARFAPRLAPDPRPVRLGPSYALRWINMGAMLRSLLLFNAMFAVQNGLDFAVMIGGVGLPEGMSFAEYAHRGAYPLLALALLSGGFALLARPFITAAPPLRGLLLVWIAQTIWLTFSSALRLDLYVDAYGLTRLRIAAAIWMALVLAGLVLTLWQIGRAHSSGWLLRRVVALGLGTLYACCFVSFDALIAHYNLNHHAPLDVSYLCDLTETAAPVLLSSKDISCWNVYPARSLDVYEPADWREWGFRNARVRHSLRQLAAEGRIYD
jgi:hypothetical protein